MTNVIALVWDTVSISKDPNKPGLTMTVRYADNTTGVYAGFSMLTVPFPTIGTSIRSQIINAVTADALLQGFVVSRFILPDGSIGLV